MVIKTYFDKSNTLIYDSEINVGLNPITELFYGDDFSRYILHFDINRIKELVCNGTYYDITKLKHVLKMTNTASINGVDKYTNMVGKHKYQRATSFELILFPIPQSWDGGKGYDYYRDVWRSGDSKISNQASNWFQAKTGIQWGNIIYPNFKHSEPNENPHLFYDGLCNGIYDNEFIMSEYDKYKNGQPSIIITTQDFDIGNENLSLDITDYINKVLNNDILYPNNGLCLMFAPFYENIKVIPRQYVGFFTENTSSFFEPFLETTYDDYIKDDRNNFHIDKLNRLYFYANIGGKLQNLYKLPKCKIQGDYENGDSFCVECEVKQGGVGVYYVEILLPSNGGLILPNRMFYDVWSDIVFQNEDGSLIKIHDTELEFVTISADKYYNFTSYNTIPNKYKINISGIKYGEQIKQGDIRKIICDARIAYTSNQSDIMADMEYRIYIKNGGEELTIIDFTPMNRTIDHNFFLIDTLSFLPNKYLIDVRTIANGELIIHKDVGEFSIINNVEEIYK